MLLPDSLREALLALRPIGRPRLVGGCVRDWLMGIASKDFDVEVGGVDFPTLHQALAPLGATDVVGRAPTITHLHVPALLVADVS